MNIVRVDPIAKDDSISAPGVVNDIPTVANAEMILVVPVTTTEIIIAAPASDDIVSIPSGDDLACVKANDQVIVRRLIEAKISAVDVCERERCAIGQLEQFYTVTPVAAIRCDRQRVRCSKNCDCQRISVIQRSLKNQICRRYARAKLDYVRVGRGSKVNNLIVPIADVEQIGI